jgi:hypothetical protein
MPTPTYVSLATITLGSADSEIIFSSIPATYRDLVVSFAGSTNFSEQYLLRLNGDTGSNYSWVQMGADGTTFSSSTTTTGVRVGYFATSSARDDAQISVLDYSATDKHKSVLVRTNSPEGVSAVRAVAGRWANTDAVTSLTITFPSGSFAIGSTFSLYGIAA